MLYLAYDVETANCRDIASICAVGWVLFDGSCKIIDRGYSLINPQCEFSPSNISIHHIRPEDVADAPTFEDYWIFNLKDVLVGSVLVAHGAGFDVAATQRTLDREGIPYHIEEYIDTVSVLRRCVPGLSHYGLSDLAKWAGYQFNHHCADEDALAIVKIIENAIKINRVSSFEELLDIPNDVLYYHHESNPRLSSYKRYKDEIEKIIEAARWEGVDFNDIHFAFHGELKQPDISRKNGLDIIITELGGTYHNKPSRSVDFFVCFDEQETNSVKEAKKIASDSRYHLNIIGREEFLELIAYNLREPNLDEPALIRTRKMIEMYQKEYKEIKVPEKKKASPQIPISLKDESPFRKLKAVDQYTLDGEYIKTFESAGSAEMETGIHRDKIKDAARGKQKTAGGFCWKYKDETA